ncbi:hypothetical protein [Lignipirellula cremea]|uniref:Uncharacterized protein n=1 Tax=Lignipirellula cremea TaxID=2528010 RepID=A0A518DLX0_9BACT|nr:hypothetical protein [Lignipirellula cremea]QDU92840.1 hypothetical protein Pla8534_06130 [Lignipirellula cremea]
MNEMIQGLHAVEKYFSEFENVDWFSKVGCEYDRPGIQMVTSWKAAYQWASHELTEWCDLEAKNLIYRFMSSNHYNEFVKWNNVAESILPHVLKVVNHARQLLPADAPADASEWLQCQLLGATLEVYYERFIASSLLRKHLEIYNDGHFPCGWKAVNETSFPENSVIIVY